jgi:hypothetical protein
MAEFSELSKYLEKAIQAWTKTYATADNKEQRIIASCYVDALQGVKSRFLEPKKKENV